MFYRHTLLVIIAAAITRIVITDIRMHEIYQLDSFGDFATLWYEEGTMSILCTVVINIPCTLDNHYHLIDPFENIVATNSCTDAKVWFNLRVRDLPFGLYKCRYKDDRQQISKTTSLDYKICSDSSDACINSPECGDKNKFCVITEKETHSCSVPKKCVGHSTGLNLRMCGFYSLCHVLANNTNQYEITYALDDPKTYKCVHHANRPRLFDGVPYNAPVAIYESRPTLNYSCHNILAYPLPFECVIRRQDRTIIQIENTTCRDQTNISLNHDILSAGSQVYKVNCKFSNGRDTLSRLSNVVVVFASNLVVHDQWVNTTSGKFVHILSCYPTPPVSAAFQIRYWWTSDKYGDAATISEGKNFTADHNETYVCHATITYKSCAPHRLFVYNISSGKIQSLTVSNNATNTRAPSQGTSAAMILMVSWMRVFYEVTVMILIYFLYVKKD